MRESECANASTDEILDEYHQFATTVLDRSGKNANAVS